MINKIVRFVLCVALVVGTSFGCTASQRQTIKEDCSKIAQVVGPLLTQAGVAMAAVQQNYDFWAALVTGTLQVAGVHITQAQIDAARPVISAMDAVLVPLGAAVNNNAVDPAAVENAITAVNYAVPTLTQKALANPAISALYTAYLSGKTNVNVPAN